MESDFVTRQHLDSVSPSNDPSTFELLNKYKFPPANSQVPITPSNPPSGFGNYSSSTDNQVLFSNMLGQIQGSLQQLGLGQKTAPVATNGLDGIELKVNADILRWVILVIILIVLVWVILKVQNNKRRNPIKRRLKKLEKQIRRLRRMNPNKSFKQITQDDEFYQLEDGSEGLDDLDEIEDELDSLS